MKTFKTQWFKWIFVLLIAVTLLSCSTRVDYTLYDVAYTISIKMDREQLTNKPEYHYWYKLETEGGTEIGWYTDKNYEVGGIIWIGSRFGKHYEQPKEE